MHVCTGLFQCTPCAIVQHSDPSQSSKDQVVDMAMKAKLLHVQNQHSASILKNWNLYRSPYCCFLQSSNTFHMRYPMVAFVWQQFMSGGGVNTKATSTLLPFKCYINDSLTNDAKEAVGTVYTVIYCSLTPTQ